MARLPCYEERIIEDIFTTISGSKKAGIIAWQALQARTAAGFQIQWDNVGICLVQIARGDKVWLINLNRIKAFPGELRRLLSSPDVVKAGVGVASDLQVFWNDLGCDVNNVVDCGLMAKLLYAEKYANTPFTNLSLQTVAEETLKVTVSKAMQLSNWKGDDNGDLSAEQRKYAAIDAHACSEMYPLLVAALEDKADVLGQQIPSDWYTVNGRYGQPTRLRRTYWGKEVEWNSRDCPWFFGGKFQGY
ncbi:ribonuclease H-like domain-containing protein [Mycena metata]|uniref:Ribonuclease H-like domain-containing protein n=1 Tax=Mycena metata TaxID=1033252 RepID=A0AAD7GV49_9AGAR|nr:ribonuclease H-like domain-containing protein [Mycena metata]